MTLYYPNSNIEVKQGDILYSTIGRSTYYVGHTVMIGSIYIVKRTNSGKPSRHSVTINKMCNRHRKGDKITLLRGLSGAQAAAKWVTENLGNAKDYWILNSNISNREK